MKKLFLSSLFVVFGIIWISTFTRAKNDINSIIPQITDTQKQCLKNAMETRENTIYSIVSNYQSGILSALSTKKDSSLSARKLTSFEEIKLALKNPNKTYKSTERKLKIESKKLMKLAHKQFKRSADLCKVKDDVISVEWPESSILPSI